MLTRDNILSVLAANLEPIRRHLENHDVREIMVNPGGRTFLEIDGQLVEVEERLRDDQITGALKALGKSVRQDVLADTANAVISASVGQNRLAGALDPVSFGGPSLCIRLHREGKRQDVEELVQRGALSQTLADNLIREFVENKLNLLIGGGTSAGKTTIANAFASKIPPYERIVTIEDARELQIENPNWVPFLANHDKGITPRLLVQQALRYRPDRIVIGETRGNETYDVIRAMNSGHDGTLTTIHGSSARESLGALEMLFQMSLPQGASVPADTARRYIAKAVHLVIYAARRVRYVDGKPLSMRRVEEAFYVRGVDDNGNYVLEEVPQ